MHYFSYLFHPVFIPLMVFMFIHLRKQTLCLSYSKSFKLFLSHINLHNNYCSFINNSIKKKYGIIDSYEINNHKKRHHALFPALIWNCVCYYLVRGLLYFSSELNIIFITPIVLIFVCLIISNFLENQYTYDRFRWSNGNILLPVNYLQ